MQDINIEPVAMVGELVLGRNPMILLCLLQF